MTTRHCSSCGHETAGRRKVRPDLCGPCYAGKPVGWWDDLPKVLARLGMPAALLAWGLAGGGGGCTGVPPTNPVPVPFGCAQFPNTIHVAYIFGPGLGSEQLEPAFGVQDCEWDGVNNSGPLDGDEFDPQGDPRSNWFYLIQPDGSFFNLQTIWAADPDTTGQAITIVELTLPVTAGARYTIIDETSDNGPTTESLPSIRVQCPGDVERNWDTDDLSPLQWTAVQTGTCFVRATQGCFQIGPAGFADCGDTIRAVRG